MIHIEIYMADTNDSIMDDSVVDISPPTIVDVIDLTSPSGSIRRSRSHQRNIESSSVTSNRRTRRPLSPIVLGNTQDTQMKNPKRKKRMPHATSSNTILTIDDTVKEDKTYYTVEMGIKEPIPLTCPVCFESLTSNLKPITTRCGHLFCSECLESFIRISKKCPSCKSSITLKSCTRIYL